MVRPRMEMRAADELPGAGFSPARAKKAAKAAPVREAAPFSSSAAAPSANASWQQLSLRVTDLTSGSAEVTAAAGGVGGAIVRHEPAGTGSRIVARIPASRYREFLGRLERIGSLAHKPAPPAGITGDLELTVTVEPAR